MLFVCLGDFGDFCFVSVHRSGLSVRIRLGSGSFEADIGSSVVPPPTPSTSAVDVTAAAVGGDFRFDDDQWHVVVLSRETREVSIFEALQVCHRAYYHSRCSKTHLW